MEGFKVICNKCNKEHQFKNIVKVYEWTIDVKCECGNELIKWYNSEAS